MSVADRIASATAANTQLLIELSQSDHATVSLQQHERYLTSLRREITAAEDHLHSLQMILQTRAKDHERYRDSTMRRMASRLGGQRRAEQFAAKEARQERDYLAAVQEEWRFSKSRDGLEQRLVTALKEQGTLVAEKAKHAEAQRNLENLYAEIFDGPTPEFPEEDEAERPFREAKKEYDAVHAKLQATGQAATLLTDAVNEMEIVVKQIENASKGLRADLWILGNQFTDIPERDSLNHARLHASQCASLLSSAQHCDSNVPALHVPQIVQGRLISDTLFDGLLPDALFHENMNASVQDCQGALIEYEVALDACLSRITKLRKESEGKKRALDEARQQLFEVRKTVMMGVASPSR